MANKLRVAQIGCGGRAGAHLAGMRDCGAVEIVALCDSRAENLQNQGREFGVAKLYQDAAEMIRTEQPELVNIVTKPTRRLATVEAAVAAGAPALLIEKPMAVRPSEARRLRELGRDRLIAVNTQYQWMPHWQRFWDLLDARELGEVRLLRASTRCNILEQGPHVLDLVLKAAAISGLPDPEWVLAACHGVEQIAQVNVPSDTSATIGLGEARLHFNAGPSAPEVPGEVKIWYQQQVEVIGNHGRLWVSLNQGWKLWREGKFETGATGWPKGDHESQPAIFVDLRDALHGGDCRQFPTRTEIAARNADLMFGCYASALGGGRMSLGQEWPDSLVDDLERLAV